jgi:hypothetical protein
MNFDFTVDFKVVAVSENTNSFGLSQCVLVANNGLAYKVCANSINIPKEGDIVKIPYKAGANGISDATLNFASRGFEIPERIEDAPREIIDEVWL